MLKAADYQMLSSLRHLFVVLLMYCNSNNLKELWKKFESEMLDSYSKYANLSSQEIHYKVLNSINDILYSMGRDINEFQLISEKIKVSTIAKEAKDVHFERNISVSDKDLLLKNKLNNEQQTTYNIILERVFSNKPGAFFIDGPGGTGKIFFISCIISYCKT